MRLSIPSKKRKQLFEKLSKANTSFQKTYPGDKPERQAVHTVYGGANLFKSDSAKVLGMRALESFNTYAPDVATFAKVFGLEGSDKINHDIYQKVKRKLETEAIEDFRIDFEDGYGNRSNDEEDE